MSLRAWQGRLLAHSLSQAGKMAGNRSRQHILRRPTHVVATAGRAGFGMLCSDPAACNTTWLGREHSLHIGAAGRARHAEPGVLIHAHGLCLVFHRDRARRV